MLHSISTRSVSAIIGLIVLSVMLAACGSPSDAASASASAARGFPIAVMTGGSDSVTTVTIESRPTRIVSLSPSATETLFAIGAEDEVVAVDSQSDYPDGVPITGLSGAQPDAQAIASYRPDLVVMAQEDSEVIAELAHEGVPTLVLPPAEELSDVYDQIERLGWATGRHRSASGLISTMKSAITSYLETSPDLDGTSYFLELDPDLTTTSTQTFLGRLYGLFGITNIADDSGQPGDRPQLSDEYIIETDPDVIFLADAGCCDVTAGKLAERPGWEGLQAIQKNQVFTADTDIANRWGPRVVDYVGMISGYLATVEDR
ncbi:ABC transporter substrate-binding protein [Propionimicrobium sp. PCR01-08-3]|uniref:ABC transporter substrate-binding protein n=1 Tax=Propionimicrobium sp. PCR01-08-3 TaxID=3052086 RepID=UPI00255C572A|nr:ABC transporter substrate-binding protein [Propionimicrobium sp. PCR01-08-3]WIY81566.1 ABC transporter substrate-binding protein [Propionimicrobium sp. PCR01-08-3]